MDPALTQTGLYCSSESVMRSLGRCSRKFETANRPNCTKETVLFDLSERVGNKRDNGHAEQRTSGTRTSKGANDMIHMWVVYESCLCSSPQKENTALSYMTQKHIICFVLSAEWNDSRLCMCSIQYFRGIWTCRKHSQAKISHLKQRRQISTLRPGLKYSKIYHFILITYLYHFLTKLLYLLLNLSEVFRS